MLPAVRIVVPPLVLSIAVPLIGREIVIVAVLLALTMLKGLSKTSGTAMALLPLLANATGEASLLSVRVLVVSPLLRLMVYVPAVLLKLRLLIVWLPSSVIVPPALLLKVAV